MYSQVENSMEPEDPKQLPPQETPAFTPDMVQAMIDASIKSALSFAAKQFGDTPTDANQLVPKKYVDGKVFPGQVDTNGSGLLLPANWTSSQLGTGQYRVTHNLGISATSYSVVVTPFGIDVASDFVVFTVSAQTTTTFDVGFVQCNSVTVRVNTPFNFNLVKV